MTTTDVKVILANGDSITTSINLPPDDARAYYLGKIFNVGSVRDNLQKCVDVEIL